MWLERCSVPGFELLMYRFLFIFEVILIESDRPKFWKFYVQCGIEFRVAGMRTVESGPHPLWLLKLLLRIVTGISGASLVLMSAALGMESRR